MDYVIIFYVLGAIGLAIIGEWKWFLGEVAIGGAFLAISAMVYLMEGKKPAHEMEWHTPIFERIEEECGRVRASGVSAQLARRLRRYMKAQPPLEEGEYYAVFCGGEGVEVMRRGCPTEAAPMPTSTPATFPQRRRSASSRMPDRVSIRRRVLSV